MLNKLSFAIAIGMTLSIVAVSVALTTDRQPGDLPVATAVQDLPDSALGRAANFGNEVGTFQDLGLIGIALIIVLLIRGRRAEAAFVLAGGLWHMASPLLKFAIERPRPTPDELFVPFMQSSYGFPSGHVFGATIVLGSVLLFSGLCLRSNHFSVHTIRLAAIGIFLAVALSRIYLGQHLPSYVIGGFVISATGMAIIYVLFKRRFPYFGKAHPVTG